MHQTDLKIIRNLLTDFKCVGCKEQQKEVLPSSSSVGDAEPISDRDRNAVTFKPIGVVRSDFPEKRAVPRQPSVCSKLAGYIELSKDVFNNPEHSLERLSEFSHLWIIYHFHKNDSHAKAKVAPPRLGGERVGIFSTRSPHRPCPIGLSLVEIDRIEACRIYFHGTDMVDGTPVLDLKPYIPRYDSPVRNQLTGNKHPNYFSWMIEIKARSLVVFQKLNPYQQKMRINRLMRAKSRTVKRRPQEMQHQICRQRLRLAAPD